MNSFNTNAHDFRSSSSSTSSKRKCFSLASCLVLFVLLMSQASCRPSDNDNTHNNANRDDALTYIDNDYIDPDDIEWKNFATAVETTPKVHPIIFYKEDIVSEDYDPSKDENDKMTQKQKKTKPHHRRKYKEITRHHRHRNHTEETYRYIKPEKVYFDIDPIEHSHDSTKEVSNEDDNKFNDEDIHVEVLSLLDDVKVNRDPALDGDSPSKDLLDKKPKKYNRRYRRYLEKEKGVDLTSQSLHFRHKRNPYYRSGSSHHSHNQVLPLQDLKHLLPYYYSQPNYPVKMPVKATKYTNAYSPSGGTVFCGNNCKVNVPTSDPVSTDNRVGEDEPFDADRPVWGSDNSITRTTSTTLPPRRTHPPVIQAADESYVPPTTSRPRFPATMPTLPPRRTHPPVIQAADESFMRTTTARPRIPNNVIPVESSAPASKSISQCIWAISSCCNSSQKIRYQCFERLGCYGAFWGLNPCADNDFHDSAIRAADEYLD